MPVMFCQFNMFDVESQVYCIEEGQESYSMFKGNFEEITDFLAAEYQQHEYEKIVLAGPYAEVVEQRVRTSAAKNFDCQDIKIEVI